jgi:hypothetical protein
MKRRTSEIPKTPTQTSPSMGDTTMKPTTVSERVENDANVEVRRSNGMNAI